MSSCGVANWGGPKPGDPSNNSVLQARPAMGGIDLSWTMPTLNPFAVAHTKVYRGINDEFVNAIQILTWNGDQYFDRVASGIQYFYWIKFVSVNGTEGELIGPASAMAYDTIEQLLQDLTGRIDAGVLAQALRAQIDRIQPISADLMKEIQDRIASNLVLSDFLNSLDSNVDQVMSLVQDEITQRTEGDSVLLEKVNTIALGQGDTAALITEERNLRISADEALAEDINLMYVQVGQDISAAKSEVSTAFANADSALANTISQQYATKNGLTAAIQDEATTRVNADGALSQRITNIETSGSVDAYARSAIQEEATTRSNADGSLGQRITSVETANYGGQIAQVQQNLNTYATTNNGIVTGIGAMYTVKLNVNGLIGGFGTYNDGNTVQMGFDVDTFWVGRTNANKVKPFMMVDGVVYIDQAKIRAAQIETLMIGANQVTVPVGVYTAGAIGTNWNTDNIIQQAWINSSGNPIMISAHARTMASNLFYYYILLRDGVEIYNMYSEYFNGNPLSYALAINMIDTPGPGVHEYRLVLRHGGNVYGNDPETGQPYTPPNASKRSITLLEVKR